MDGRIATVVSREARSGSARKWYMYYVYSLLSEQNKDVYIGYSEDLKKRYQEHNNGLVKATRGYRPWKLVYYEAYRAKLDATRREAQLKKNHRIKKDLRIQIKYSL